MSEYRPTPKSIDECAQEVARLGLRLVRLDTPRSGYRLVEDRGGAEVVIETFWADLWTELESAQAAVRFARYFSGNS